MAEGRLQQVGPPQAVYERPHNLFVARFIGSPPMNTIPGTFVVDGGEAFVDLGTGRFRVDAVGGEAVIDGTKVIVGVRPEHLVIDEGPIEATVTAVATRMRQVALDDMQRTADRQTSTMFGPTMVFVLGVVAFLAYPLAVRVLDAFSTSAI